MSQSIFVDKAMQRIGRQAIEESAQIIVEERRRGRPTSEALLEAQYQRVLTYWILNQPDLAWREYASLADLMSQRAAGIDRQSRHWRGCHLAGRSLRIDCPHGGLGDLIQAIRFVSLVDRAEARVHVQTRPELLELFTASLESHIQWFTHAEAAPPADFEIDIALLPFVLRTTYEDIGSCVPYLHPPNDLKKSWRQRLTDRHPRPWIGLFWSHNPPAEPLDPRAVPLSALRPLIEPQEATFISLEKENRRDEIRSCGLAGQILDVADECAGFSDLAALISQLDLVISVDTSIGHLAGALAQKTWLLLTHDPCHRWLMGQQPERSLWYPTMCLYRQLEPGCWDPTLEELSGDLSDFTSESCPQA